MGMDMRVHEVVVKDGKERGVVDRYVNGQDAKIRAD